MVELLATRLQPYMGSGEKLCLEKSLCMAIAVWVKLLKALALVSDYSPKGEG